MKLIKKANGKQAIRITKAQWLKIGQDLGWRDMVGKPGGLPAAPPAPWKPSSEPQETPEPETSEFLTLQTIYTLEDKVSELMHLKFIEGQGRSKDENIANNKHVEFLKLLHSLQKRR